MHVVYEEAYDTAAEPDSSEEVQAQVDKAPAAGKPSQQAFCTAAENSAAEKETGRRYLDEYVRPRVRGPREKARAGKDGREQRTRLSCSIPRGEADARARKISGNTHVCA